MTLPPNTFSNTPPNTNVIDADEVNENFDVLRGNLAAENFSDALLALLGVTDGADVRRGVSVRAGVGTRTDAAYGALNDGADEVATVVLPTNGKLVIGFFGLWKCSGTNPRAAIFLGAEQLKIGHSTTAAPAAQAAAFVDGAATDYRGLSSFPLGLVSVGEGLNTSVVTTGQAIGLPTGGGDLCHEVGGARVDLPDDGFAGGACEVWAAAGTYTVAVKYKSATGQISAKERRLWVEARGY